MIAIDYKVGVHQSDSTMMMNKNRTDEIPIVKKYGK